MKKKFGYLLLVMLFMLCVVSCGKREEVTSKTSKSSRKVSTVIEESSAETTATPLPTQIPKGVKKTIEECLRGLLDVTAEELQAEYFKEGSIKYNKLSDWKDAKGNYHCPKGYILNYMPNAHALMAEQQMPQELLDEIGTEDLYKLILSIPHKYWGDTLQDTYLAMVAVNYVSYNYMTEFIRREDSAEIVHRYYQKYSKKDKSTYTMVASAENYGNYKDTEAERAKAYRFQLTEGLEWFYLYKDGKEVPNEHYLGLGCMGHF